ncbi:MAG: type II secretion system F family protein [Phycisphaerae bacterium]
MPKFAYEIRDGAGKNVGGVLAADSLDDASRALRKEGKTILSLHEDHAAPASAAPGLILGRVKRDEVIFMATQLAVMVDTGVQLSEALDSIAQQAESEAMKAIMRDISDMVKGGSEFSAALAKHQRVFGKLFVSLVRASEASGTMGLMLQRVSDYLQQERDTVKKIKGALVYPLCMMAFCALVVVGLLTFVLPRFQKIYEGKGATLPLPTRALLAMSNGLVNYWPMVLVGLAAVVAGCWFYFHSPAGQMFLDRVRIRMPILGGMYRKAYLARSLRTMATMVTTGVSMLEGLEISAKVAGNYFYSKVWLDLAGKVKQGRMLSEELAGCKLIPRTVTQMIAAGEKTGKLGVVMNRVAGFCESDLAVAVKAATTLIEPLMIIIMGLIVGGIAMALLLPVFTISRVVAH